MVTKEQIDSVFAKEEEHHKKCSVVSDAVERLLKARPVIFIISLILIFECIFLICSPDYKTVLLRAGMILLITVGILLLIFIAIFANILCVSFSQERKKLMSPKGWFWYELDFFILAKGLEKGSASAEEKILKRINRLDGRAVSVLYLYGLFGHYQKNRESDRCRDIVRKAQKLRGLDEYSDRIIVLMEYCMSLDDRNYAETIRIFEENQKHFLKNAFETADMLIAYLNNLGEYYFALGDFSAALETFNEKSECIMRQIDMYPEMEKKSYEKQAGAFTDIVRCLVKLERYYEAVPYLKKAKELTEQKYFSKLYDELSDEISEHVNIT